MYDYIIVGHGIAGSILSYTLSKKGMKIVVVDKGFQNSSSTVAAGLYNPITGKRLFKTWSASKIFPFLVEFYNELQTDIKEKIFYEMPVYKPFSSIEEQNLWATNPVSSESDLVNPFVQNEKYAPFIDNRFGGFETKASGYVDVKKMLIGIKEYLEKNNVLITDTLNLEDLSIKTNAVTWKDKAARKIIFCEGYKAIESPLFKWLPFGPVKGETITVKIKNFNLTSILNKKVFILPLGNDIYKVGSTFKWVVDPNTTAEGREELIEKLKELIKVPFEVIDHEAGIRPAAKDRRPFIGLHPEFSTVGIFNGLGTKGISLAPYFANEFYNFLEDNGEIDPEANISRYYSLYYDVKD